MVSKSETCTGATCWNLEFIYNLFPKFECADALVAATQNDCSEKLAKVEFAATNRGHFEVFVPHVCFLEQIGRAHV